jgi:CheY-like chemotaxis protein
MVFNGCLPGGAVWCNADATRLEEVFINLLTNAAKYTPDGGRIEVWCEHGGPGAPETNHVQVGVRDNGMGIDKELLPRIFDLFTQADRSLARSAGGLGIGLSLAHRIVDMHGGTIEAHSPPEGASPLPLPKGAGVSAYGPGSEFIVKLPSIAPPPEMERSQEPANECGVRPEALRVLVVDDNIDLVTMLATSLRQKGYSVKSAHDGPAGLKVAQEWSPNVVLLDIGLPGLDGYEVVRRIRSAPEPDLQKARLIALTGYGRDVDIHRAREAGFDAHVVKPYDFNELEKLMVAPFPSGSAGESGSG